MNANVLYISDGYSSGISCLQTTLLSDYILTRQEQQYLSTVGQDTERIISNLMSTAAVKAGSTLCTQIELNKIYARFDNSMFNQTDRLGVRNFLDKNLVGYGSVELKDLV